MTEWYVFPNVKSTEMLSFLFGSTGLWPDLPSPFGRKFLSCLLEVMLTRFGSLISPYVPLGHQSGSAQWLQLGNI